MLRRPVLGFLCLAAALASPATARAQDASTPTDSENVTTVQVPTRVLTINGAQTSDPSNLRPNGLNPTGVSYSDCEEDLELDFSMLISGFAAIDSAHIEMWAGTVDCTQDGNRTTTGVAHPCWKVAANTSTQVASSAISLPDIDIWARDILRWEQPPTTLTSGSYGFDPTFHASATGEAACHVQQGDAGVQINVFFLPVNSEGHAFGTAYEYQLSTDLVGPPPPPSVGVTPGDTLITVQWGTPAADPDLIGFNVYSDPPSGAASTGGCSCGGTPGSNATSYVASDASDMLDDGSTSMCIDANTATSTPDAKSPGDGAVETGTAFRPLANPLDAEATDGAPDDAEPTEASVTDAMTPTDGATGVTDAGTGHDAGTVIDAGTGTDASSSADAGNSADAGPPPATATCSLSCASAALTGNMFNVGSTTITTVTAADGAVEDAGLSYGGGISEIAPKYLGAGLTSGSTTITLSGLTNGVFYKVGVASTDGTGNVGPLSPLQCTVPVPISDFWTTYKSDQGNVTGCALESGGADAGVSIFGLGLLAVAAAFVRRRRRPRG